MTRIVLQGANGHMGKAVALLAEKRSDCEIVAGIDTSLSSGHSLFMPLYQK